MAMPNPVPKAYEKGQVTKLRMEADRTYLVRPLWLPHTDAAGKKARWYGKWVIHYGCGKYNLILPCLQEMFGEPCYRCEQAAALEKAGGKRNRGDAFKMRAVTRHVFTALDVTFGANSDKVVLVEIPDEAWPQVKRYLDDPQWGNLADPDGGYVLTVKTAKTRAGWTINAQKNPTPLPNRAVLQQVYDLQRIYGIRDYAEQRRICGEVTPFPSGGGGGGGAREESRADAPASSAPAPASAPTSSGARESVASAAAPTTPGPVRGETGGVQPPAGTVWYPRCRGSAYADHDWRCRICPYIAACKAVAAMLEDIQRSLGGR